MWRVAALVLAEMSTGDHAVAVERAVLARIGGEAGLAQAALVEAAAVQDHHAAGLSSLQVDLEGRGVERHQHVGAVADGVDAAGAEIDLEGRDAEGGADGCPDLGREVGEGLEVVAGECRRQGELGAGELHAVAAVAGEAHHGGLQLAPAAPARRRSDPRIRSPRWACATF